jgi:hypothetical protein
MSEVISALNPVVGPQSPSPGTINLDHIAHFVPDREACRQGLQQLGFRPTPFSEQYHRLQPDAELIPAGTGNHCVMLREGYLEFLVPLADTPVAAQLRVAIARYLGAHSIIFGSGDAHFDHDRLLREGFAPLAPIALQRTIATLDGEANARFSVIRVPPGTMAEGRIQFCQHHTQDVVWQPRWIDHPNAVTGLAAVLICVDDLAAAADRYARFTGLRPDAEHGVRRFQTRRGTVELYDRVAIEARLQACPPAVPWIAGCTLKSRDLDQTRHALTANAMPVREPRPRELHVRGPAGVGGIFLFVDA